MRIAIVVPYRLGRPGGVQTAALLGGSRLAGRGHEVTVFAPSDDTEVAPEQSKVEVILDDGFSAFPWTTPSGTVVDIAVPVRRSRMVEQLKSPRFDVVHVHEPTTPMGLSALHAAMVPTVGTFHAAPQQMWSSDVGSSWNPDRLIVNTLGLVAKLSSARLDAATAVSRTAASRARWFCDNAVTLVPNPVALAGLSGSGSGTAKRIEDGVPGRQPGTEMPPPKGPRRRVAAAATVRRSSSPYRKREGLLYVGRVEPRKRVEALIRAHAELAEEMPGLQLRIAGDGPSIKRCRALVARLGSKGVTFLGPVDDYTKTLLLQTAAVFCSPADRGESFGIAPIEALINGCRVVVGPASGYRETFEGAGAVCRAGRGTEALSRALRDMLVRDSMPEGWERWKESTLKRFDADRVVAQWELVYREATRSSQGRAER